MFLFGVKSGAPLLIAGAGTGVTLGYSKDNFGQLLASPVSVRQQGSEMTQLYRWNFSGQERLTLRLTGDQTAFLSGKTLSIASTDYAIADADSGPTYDSGNDVTNTTWEFEPNPFVEGNSYIIRIE